MNYLTLVNKNNPIDESFYDDIVLVKCLDILEEPVEVEDKTYEAYIKLRAFLATKNIFVELDSAYRSIDEQQQIIDDYLIKYGADYVSKYVAPIKTSEHHTGLALDLALVVNGKKLYENEDLFANEDIYLEIHKYLANYGFILRYPKGKEEITGYNYEPWHIRYVGDYAKEITENNMTLEEYVQKTKNR